jgi:hypothetical protein
MTAPIPPFPVAALVGIQQAGERAGWGFVCGMCDVTDCHECGCECHE